MKRKLKLGSKMRTIELGHKVGDTVWVRDDELGEQRGVVVRFNHEGRAVARFPDGSEVVVPE